MSIDGFRKNENIKSDKLYNKFVYLDNFPLFFSKSFSRGVFSDQEKLDSERMCLRENLNKETFDQLMWNLKVRGVFH